MADYSKLTSGLSLLRRARKRSSMNAPAPAPRTVRSYGDVVAQRLVAGKFNADLASAGADPTVKWCGIEHQASSRKRAIVKKAFGTDVAARDYWARVMRVIADNA